MKSLIKLFFFLVIICVICLIVWARPVLEKIGSRALNTNVRIKQARFIPYKLMFEIYGISLPKKDTLIPSGKLRLIPLKLELYGLKLNNRILLREKNFFIELLWQKGWKINITLNQADLSKFGYGFKRGKVSGDIAGIYSRGNCAFSGLLRFKDLVYADSDNEFLGMTADEFEEIIDAYNGQIEMDFNYNGPFDEIDNLTHYSPGRKTIQLLAAMVAKKIFQ